MTYEPEPRNEALVSAKVYLTERQQWLQDAVELVTGNKDIDPQLVFDAPTKNKDEARADAPVLELNADQELALREIAGRFGIGGETDVASGAEVQVNEGGKIWKVEGEAAISNDATTVIFAGSPYRRLGKDELDYAAKKSIALPADATEYDMVRKVAQEQEGFVGLEEDEDIGLGYDIDNQHSTVVESTGQLVKIGHNQERPILLLRIDREQHDDGSYAKQPDSAAILKFIGDVLMARDDESSAVGLNTSTTYASRVVDTVRAGLNVGRTFRVGMYGRQTLASAKGEPIAQPTSLNQIPGELRVMHDKLQLLAQELQ